MNQSSNNNEFVFLFRQPASNHSPEKQKEINKKWNDWIGNIAAQGKIAANGLHLKPGGNVLKASGIVTDGPFVEIREILGGFIVIKADTMEEAITMAHGCPTFDEGGSVEIRTAFAD
ncbi:YciI family protein [Mucilaginibacter boryungensis]|uniref:Transcription initiation protein n=1 Tax=Mucilaginibacter boryungensis TaxID=768480 RepID=A0ABR9XCL9_9SPHI|nr:YciI family protein [Mucilaginibacter boryungensis]MBE9665151.1 transcription initiation protein [Mucilaginibacter boryungensis]